MIELGKKYMSNGRPVRIVCVDNAGTWPVVGVFDDGEVSSWGADGTFLAEYPLTKHRDLIPVPTKHLGWGVVNKKGDLTGAFSGEFAWEKANIQSNVFAGDTVVRLHWED